MLVVGAGGSFCGGLVAGELGGGFGEGLLGRIVGSWGGGVVKELRKVRSLRKQESGMR